MSEYCDTLKLSLSQPGTIHYKGTMKTINIPYKEVYKLVSGVGIKEF
jgi:hypothetical protein